VLSDLAFEDRDLLVEEVNLAHAPIDGLALIAGQLELAQPDAAALAEHVGHRRAALEVSHQNRVHLVLAARPLAHELRAASESATQRARVLVGQPTAVQQARGKQSRERAGVTMVGLDLGLGDRPQLLASGHDHACHVWLQQPRDRQRVASRLQRDLIVGIKTVRQDLQALRSAGHAASAAHPALLNDRDLAEVEMHIQPDETQPTLPFTRMNTGDQVGKRQERIRARSPTG
jgi:hypothetical protein